MEAICARDPQRVRVADAAHDFPPWDTVDWYFQRWNADGTTDRIHDALRGAVRQAAGREAAATA